MNTTLTIIGTVATDPKLINPASGTQLCSFRLASDERRFDPVRQNWVEGETNWFGVVCFRGLAANAYASFRKGERIIVTGKLRVRRWSKDDRQGTSVEIEAEAIGHDVRFGISRFDKRSGSTGAGGANAAQAAPAPFDQQPEPELGEEPSLHPASMKDESETAHESREGDGFTPAMAA